MCKCRRCMSVGDHLGSYIHMFCKSHLFEQFTSILSTHQQHIPSIPHPDTYTPRTLNTYHPCPRSISLHTSKKHRHHSPDKYTPHMSGKFHPSEGFGLQNKCLRCILFGLSQRKCSHHMIGMCRLPARFGCLGKCRKCRLFTKHRREKSRRMFHRIRLLTRSKNAHHMCQKYNSFLGHQDE